MRHKAQISFFLVLTVVSVFSLNAFAVPEAAVPATKAPTAALAGSEFFSLDAWQDNLTATLTGTGTLLVNGNQVQSGATIPSGSLVATQLDGDAMLDLGPLGLVKLRPGTEIKVTYTQGRVELELRDCGSYTQTVPTGVSTSVTVTNDQIMQVAPSTGEVKVRGQVVVSDDKNAPAPNTASPGRVEEVTLKAGESRAFDKIEQITATGETTYTVNCVDNQSASSKRGLGALPYTLLAVAGVTTGVILGLTGGESSGGSSISPLQ